MMITSVLPSVAADAKKGPRIDKVEPPCWWVGMETPLQLMLYGEDLAQGDVLCLDEGVKVTALHKADSPNYIFVDVKIASHALAGTYHFEWRSGRKTLKFDYELGARLGDSAKREGLMAADLLYLIMPDRFINGDMDNDSSKETAEAPAPQSDYGRHGGDLAGIEMALPYLEKLGVTAIWPTPVTLDNEPEASYHGYACADYYRIDPRLGTNEQYVKLVAEARRRGIKFLQDIVPNHCGAAHWWMKDLPFSDWVNTFPKYTHTNSSMSVHMDPNAAQVDTDLCVRGWFDTSMADMNLTNPYVLQYMVQATVWWIEYAGLAGVRIDTYPYSDRTAIGAYSAALRKEYPQGTVLAESWYHNPGQIAYWERGPQPGGPTVMDFCLQDAIGPAFREDTQVAWDGGLKRIYNVLSLDFHYKNPGELLIFAENHDTNRSFEQVGRNPEKLKMVYTLLATMRGIPQIYYGSELMICAADPQRLGHGEERRNMRPEQLTEKGRSPLENNVYDYISRLMTWRKGSEAVQNGRLLHYLPSTEENTYVYFRIAPHQRVMVVINNGMKPFSIDWNHYAEGLGDLKQGREVLSDAKVTVEQAVQVPAQTAWVVEF